MHDRYSIVESDLGDQLSALVELWLPDDIADDAVVVNDRDGRKIATGRDIHAAP
jgi:hypothetical protein